MLSTSGKNMQKETEPGIPVNIAQTNSFSSAQNVSPSTDNIPNLCPQNFDSLFHFC